jgi:hypothetical protein
VAVPNDGGAAEMIAQPSLDIFRRQPDHAWKIARLLAYRSRQILPRECNDTLEEP